MRTPTSWIAVIALIAFVGSALPVVAADLPPGTNVYATLQGSLDSKTSKVGDPVVMTVTSAWPADDAVATAMQHATIRGHVSQVVHATPTKKAYVGIAFDTLTLTDGRTYPFPAKITALKKKKSYNAVQAMGEIAVGVGVGALIGHTAGAVIGGLGGTFYAEQMAADFRIPENSSVTMRTTEILSMTPEHPQAVQPATH